MPKKYHLPFPATKAAIRSLTLNGVDEEGAAVVSVIHLFLLLFEFAGLFSLAARKSCTLLEEFATDVVVGDAVVMKAKDFSNVNEADVGDARTDVAGDDGVNVVDSLAVETGLRLTIVVLITVVVKGDEGV